MKYRYILVLAAVSLMAINAFGESEMDSEINDLQVKIVHINPNPSKPKVARARPIQQQVTPKIYSYSARPALRTAVTKPVNANFYKPTVVPRPTLVAVAPAAPVSAPAPTNTFQPTEQYQPYEETSNPQGNVRVPAPQSTSSSDKFVRRIELIPAFTLSSFDGGDSSTLQPTGVSNTYNTAPSGSLLTDIDFGNTKFFVESGVMVSQMGSGTGYAVSNGFNPTAISEKVALTYVGVPLNLKFRLRDQDTSSFFIKAGAIPEFMVSHAYSSLGASDEIRFGAYNTFDLLLDAGVGYDFRISKSFHAIADVSAFQGLFPVLTSLSVFNYGVNLGLGIAYML